MFVLGFQEIVPLTAQQIVQTDPEKRSVCEQSTSILAYLLSRQASMGDEVNRRARPPREQNLRLRIIKKRAGWRSFLSLYAIIKRGCSL